MRKARVLFVVIVVITTLSFASKGYSQTTAQPQSQPEKNTKPPYSFGLSERVRYEYWKDLTDLNDAEASPAATITFSELYNRFHIQGPGAGVSYKLPLAENLSASVSTSLIYFSMKYYGYFIEESGTDINTGRVDYQTGVAINSQRGLQVSVSPCISSIIRREDKII